MGISTNGQLSYGFVFEEGFEFPWDVDPFYGDIEEWWKNSQGYENPNYCPFTSTGEYQDDAPVEVDQFGYKRLKRDDVRVAAYYDFHRKWMEDNPLPVEVVNYCSDECPMFILAVPSSSRCNRRGYPEKFDPAELKISERERETLLAFCRDHGIETDSAPGWWLTSYWG